MVLHNITGTILCYITRILFHYINGITSCYYNYLVPMKLWYICTEIVKLTELHYITLTELHVTLMELHYINRSPKCLLSFSLC